MNDNGTLGIPKFWRNKQHPSISCSCPTRCCTFHIFVEMWKSPFSLFGTRMCSHRPHAFSLSYFCCVQELPSEPQEFHEDKKDALTCQVVVVVVCSATDNAQWINRVCFGCWVHAAVTIAGVSQWLTQCFSKPNLGFGRTPGWLFSSMFFCQINSNLHPPPQRRKRKLT